MTDTQQTIYTIIANTLGVETTDLTYQDDFSLDLNATPEDMKMIKSQIEETLEVILPEFEGDESPTTVGELMEIVEDSLL